MIWFCKFVIINCNFVLLHVRGGPNCHSWQEAAGGDVNFGKHAPPQLSCYTFRNSLQFPLIPPTSTAESSRQHAALPTAPHNSGRLHPIRPGAYPSTGTPPPPPTLGHTNPIRTLQCYFSKINFNIDLPSASRPSKWYLPFKTSQQKFCTRFSSSPRAKHPPLFDQSTSSCYNDTWWGAQMTESLNVQFSKLATTQTACPLKPLSIYEHNLHRIVPNTTTQTNIELSVKFHALTI